MPARPRLRGAPPSGGTPAAWHGPRAGGAMIIVRALTGAALVASLTAGVPSPWPSQADAVGDVDGDVDDADLSAEGGDVEGRGHLRVGGEEPAGVPEHRAERPVLEEAPLGARAEAQGEALGAEGVGLGP